MNSIKLHKLQITYMYYVLLQKLLFYNYLDRINQLYLYTDTDQ